MAAERAAPPFASTRKRTGAAPSPRRVSTTTQPSVDDACQAHPVEVTSATVCSLAVAGTSMREPSKRSLQF
jgi:hypothetical protein